MTSTHSSGTHSLSDLWFRNSPRAPSAAVRLLCLPHAGGAASFYRPMAVGLSPDLDVLCVQYPGRQDRRHEPCFTSITDLADELTTVLLPVCDRPVALFGHSMGATVGYEVARRLAGHPDVELVRLFASGRRAPSVDANDHVSELGDDGIIAELHRMAGTMSAILGDEEIMRMSMPAIRGDYRAAESYVDTGGPVGCPITVLTGDSDHRTPPASARRWQQHSTADVDFHSFPGGHFFLAEQSAAVLELVRGHLT